MRGAKPNQQTELLALKELLSTNLVQDRSVAIDGGAHVGVWTDWLAGHFDRVLAFEPSEAFADLEHNCRQLAGVELHNAALVDRPCRVNSVAQKRQTLTARVIDIVPDGRVSGMTVDGLGLESCGLVKLDLEGAELMALRGARRTLKRHRPFVLVEMNGLGARYKSSDANVHAYLTRLGYERVFDHGVDVGFRHTKELK